MIGRPNRRGAAIAALLAIAVLGSLSATAHAATFPSGTSLVRGFPPPSILGTTVDAPSFRLGQPTSVAVAGRYAYVATGTGDSLTIVDVHNPHHPAVVGSVQDPVRLSGPVWVVVRGSTAYVTSKGHSNADLDQSSLTTVDVSDPHNPRILGSVSHDQRLYGAYGLEVVGTRAYVAAQGCVGSASCYSTTPGGNALTVVDVSNPAAPQVLGSVTALPATQHLDSVAVRGDLAYGTAFYSSQVTVFNVADPANPVVVSSLADPRLEWANDVQLQGGYAYVVDQSNGQAGASFATLSLADPAHPTIAGSVRDGAHLNQAYNLEVSGRFAFVASLVSHSLSVVDLADPSAPRVVATIDDGATIGRTGAVALAGDVAYVGNHCPPPAGGGSGCASGGHGGLTTVAVGAYTLTPVDTRITAGPRRTRRPRVRFAFRATKPGATFACKVDRRPYARCKSPIKVNARRRGKHDLYVRATSLSGVADRRPAHRRWTKLGN